MSARNESAIRESAVRVVERLPGPRGGRRRDRFVQLTCARFDDGWCWSPESLSPPTWQGPFPTLGAAEEDARLADGRVAGSKASRPRRPIRQRRHDWQDTTGLVAAPGEQRRRCSACRLEQARTSPHVLWPNSGFCPGPARLVAPKR